MDLAAKVAAALERSVLPSVIARGGAVRVTGVKDRVATLEITGSPGAVLPLISRIEAQVRAAVPEITGVRITAPAAGSPQDPAGSLAERARSVLDAEINPVIAAHRGHIALESAEHGWVRSATAATASSLLSLTRAVWTPGRRLRQRDAR
jgi:Fe-S cluster biogenesis protein NfuA